MSEDKTYNSYGTRYITEGIGRHWEKRWEIWEKSNGYWALLYWSTDKQQAMETWERVKDEPIKSYDCGWIDDID